MGHSQSLYWDVASSLKRLEDALGRGEGDVTITSRVIGTFRDSYIVDHTVVDDHGETLAALVAEGARQVHDHIQGFGENGTLSTSDKYNRHEDRDYNVREDPGKI